jgi:hypothetical protein
MAFEDNTPAIAHMRERAKAYPVGSPEREAFNVAIVRAGYDADDARIDATIMRAWRITSAVR